MPCVTYTQAKSKGLSTGRAIVGGLLFGILAVIYYSLQDKTIEKRAKEEKQIEMLKKQIK